MHHKLEDQELAPWFEALRKQPVTRSAERTKAGKERYLNFAKSLPAPVSSRSKNRLKGWNLFPIPMLTRKEFQPMASLIATILVIASLVIGGGGVTVAAAQFSLPDQPLYGIKLASENARLALAQGEPLQQAELSFQFTLRRLSEIQAMLQRGQMPAEALLQRAQQQLDLALQQAANLPPEQAN